VAIADAVFRRPGGPETKPIVVLAGKNHALHPAGFQSQENSIGIEVRRIEDGRILGAVAPFLAGKGIYCEMKEGIRFHFLPAKLAIGRKSAKGRRRCDCVGARTNAPKHQHGAGEKTAPRCPHLNAYYTGPRRDTGRRFGARCSPTILLWAETSRKQLRLRIL
jgi:hypothetical protein